MTTAARSSRSVVHRLGGRRLRSAVVAVLTAGLSLAVIGTVAPTAAHAAPLPFTVTDRTEAREVKAHQIGYLTASCKPGEDRVSGGFYNTAPAYSSTISDDRMPDLYPVVANEPLGSSSWRVGLMNRSSGDTVLLVHVLCASRSLGTVVVSQTVEIVNSASGSPWHLVGCPPGTLVTGGGWNSGPVKRLDQVIAIGASRPNYSGKDDYWQVWFGIPAESISRPSDVATVYAVCAADGVGRSESPEFPFTLLGGAPDEAVQSQQLATCAGGTKGQLTGAGFEFSVADGTRSLTSLAPYVADAPSTWSVTVNSLAGSGYEGRVNTTEKGTLLSACLE